MDAMIEKKDGLYVIFEEQDLGDDGPQIVYWPDAYSTLEDAMQAVRIAQRGGTNPQPSIKVDMGTGRPILHHTTPP